MIENLSRLISEWDSSIRQGQGFKVRPQFLKLKPAQIPRELILRVAQLGRRLSLYEFSLKLLFPIIKSHREKKQRATFDELSEYAANLIEIGAQGEAQILLSDLVKNKHIPAYLTYAFSLFREWNYQEAIPYLESFIEKTEIPYLKLVGQLNLASAYVTLGQTQASLKTLTPLKENCEKENHRLLLGSCYELLAQIEYAVKNFELAQQWIAKSENLLTESQNIAHLYTLKWKSLIFLELNPLAPESLQSIQNVKSMALSLSNWEILRDLDFRVSLIKNDTQLFETVYFGSKFDGYRKHIRTLSHFNVGESFHWMHPPTGLRILDLSQGKINPGTTSLKKGQLVHRLLTTLASDHYTTFSYGTLFSELFTGQCFDPFSSPSRVFKVIQRLRAWLQKENYPLSVKADSSGFRLKLHPGANLKKKLDSGESQSIPFQKRRAQELIELYGDQEFSAVEASTVFGLSQRQTNRVLKMAQEEGLLMQLHKGPKIKFKRTA